VSRFPGRLLALITLVPLAACGGGSTGATGGLTPDPDAPPVATRHFTPGSGVLSWDEPKTLVPKATRTDLVGAVKTYEIAVEAAKGDPLDSELAAAASELAFGAELKALRWDIYSMRRDGLIDRGKVSMHPVVLDVHSTRAAVANCSRQNEVRVLARDGTSSADNPNTGVALLRYTLERRGTRWLVDSVAIETGDRCPTQN